MAVSESTGNQQVEENGMDHAVRGVNQQEQGADVGKQDKQPLSHPTSLTTDGCQRQPRQCPTAAMLLALVSGRAHGRDASHGSSHASRDSPGKQRGQHMYCTKGRRPSLLASNSFVWIQRSCNKAPR